MWTNPILFHWENSIQKHVEKRKIFTESTEKNFLIDLLTTNYVIFRDSLTLNTGVFRLFLIEGVNWTFSQKLSVLVLHL